jgi:DNA methylase.
MTMPNLSQFKRQRMLEFLNKIREEHSDDVSLIAINEIETELTEKKYGLVWEEHEERVDIEMLTKVPVFSEVVDKEIITDDSLPYNFLLEGDNLHSLRLLEKTHKGKIDLIYIDPPYNTKEKDFIYDDKRIDLLDGYRHSKWLSFMEKRLRLAHKLLKENGLFLFL